MKTRPERRSAGFTWIEVLFVLFNLSVVIAAVLSMVTRQMNELRLKGPDLQLREAVAAQAELWRNFSQSEILSLANPTVRGFCRNPAGALIAGCVTGLPSGASSQVYIDNYDATGRVKRITITASGDATASPVAPPDGSVEEPRRSVHSMVILVAARGMNNGNPPAPPAPTTGAPPPTT